MATASTRPTIPTTSRTTSALTHCTIVNRIQSKKKAFTQQRLVYDDMCDVCIVFWVHTMRVDLSFVFPALDVVRAFVIL